MNHISGIRRILGFTGLGSSGWKDGRLEGGTVDCLKQDWQDSRIFRIGESSVIEDRLLEVIPFW